MTVELDDHAGNAAEDQQAAVRSYYGDTLQSISDLRAGSRYAAHFRLEADKQRHFGLFDCAPVTPPSASANCCCR